MPENTGERNISYATTTNYLLRITTFPMGYSSIIVRRPVTACRSIEFPLPGKILRTWSNFGWLWRTFAEKEGNLHTTCFSRTSSRYPDFDGQSCPSAGRTIEVHEAQCPGSALLRLQSVDLTEVGSPPPRSLVQTWTIYASAACGRQHWTNQTIVPEQRRIEVSQNCFLLIPGYRTGCH